MRHYFRPRPPCSLFKIYVVVPDQGSELNQGCASSNHSSTAQHKWDDLKQEGAAKKTRRSTGKFLLRWKRGWLNFNSLTAASS